MVLLGTTLIRWNLKQQELRNGIKANRTSGVFQGSFPVGLGRRILLHDAAIMDVSFVTVRSLVWGASVSKLV